MSKEHLHNKRDELGQYFTPAWVAQFMASLVHCPESIRKILDPGAGRGALSAALIERISKTGKSSPEIHLTAVEIDEELRDALKTRYAELSGHIWQFGTALHISLVSQDFIRQGTNAVAGTGDSNLAEPYDCIILNPPYRKLRTGSPLHTLLKSVNIRETNLYSAFLLLSAKLLKSRGQLIAIVPRSFCNGSYFRRFRKEFLSLMSIEQIHLFSSRSAVFNGDQVLQENIIIHARRSSKQKSTIIVSASEGHNGAHITKRTLAQSAIYTIQDPDRIVHIPTDSVQLKAGLDVHKLTTSLDNLGIKVSTGRVVAYRARKHLVTAPRGRTAPLIHPFHIRDGVVHWPKSSRNKEIAIQVSAATKSLLVPSGVYVLVKRFTTKEQARRVVAGLCDLTTQHFEQLGIENHLSFLHIAGNGLPAQLARALVGYLNSTMIDRYFRQFSGNTQVNASDIKKLPFPDEEQLNRMATMMGDSFPTQEQLDALVSQVLN